MSPDVPPSKTPIGATLRDARRRYGLEVREVEERTKIRARYIRALENEDWETLPAPAYVRGFLRTYGQLLGLDGEMLADEYRRRHGESAGAAAPGAEPLLSERRRSGQRRPSRGLLIGGVIVGIFVLILLLGLLGGDDDPAPPRGGEASKSAGKGGGAKKKRSRKQPSSAPKLRPEPVAVEARTAVQVCLVGDDGDVLIDDQQLQEGSREEFDGYKRYRLDLGPGTLSLEVGGERERLEVGEPTTFEADSTGIRGVDFRGPDCP